MQSFQKFSPTYITVYVFYESNLEGKLKQNKINICVSVNGIQLQILISHMRMNIVST